MQRFEKQLLKAVVEVTDFVKILLIHVATLV
jgi:hypothetical protein